MSAQNQDLCSIKKLNAWMQSTKLKKNKTRKKNKLPLCVHSNSPRFMSSIFCIFPLHGKKTTQPMEKNNNINPTPPPPMEKTRRSLQTGAIHPCIPEPSIPKESYHRFQVQWGWIKTSGVDTKNHPLVLGIDGIEMIGKIHFKNMNESHVFSKEIRF